MASTQTSFSNPLILRLILLNLPTKDLLLSQRVCRTWHHLIKKSHSLQKSLFLLPDSSTASSQLGTIQNDLLATHFPDFFKQNTSSRAHLGPLDSTRWNHNSHGHPAYSRSEASWRKMLPTRPPPIELQILESVSGMAGKRGTFKSHRNEGGGITFGIIHDMVQDFLLPSSEGRIDRGAYVEIVGSDDMHERLLPIVRNKLHRSWLESSKARMRKALPDVGFAGEGCVVVYLERTQQCSRGREQVLGQRVFEEDYLRSDAAEGTKKRMKWDVEKGFFVR